MTAAGISDEGHRVVLAVGALVLGAIAMGASVLFVRWADVGPYASASGAFSRAAVPADLDALGKRPANAPHASIDRAVILAGLFFTGDLFFWHLASSARRRKRDVSRHDRADLGRARRVAGPLGAGWRRALMGSRSASRWLRTGR